jgi:hypothetical protein
MRQDILVIVVKIGEIRMSDPFPGQAPTVQSAGTAYRVRLTKVSSFLVVTQRRTATYSGTLDQLEAAARGARAHTLLLGWWGIPFGLIWTPIALARNAKAMRQLRDLAAKG